MAQREQQTACGPSWASASHVREYRWLRVCKDACDDGAIQLAWSRGHRRPEGSSMDRVAASPPRVLPFGMTVSSMNVFVLPPAVCQTDVRLRSLAALACTPLRHDCGAGLPPAAAGHVPAHRLLREHRTQRDRWEGAREVRRWEWPKVCWLRMTGANTQSCWEARVWCKVVWGKLWASSFCTLSVRCLMRGLHKALHIHHFPPGDQGLPGPWGTRTPGMMGVPRRPS